MDNNGFTLLEMLITLSLFVFVVSLASTVFFNTSSNYARIRVERELTADAQFVVERIKKEFQNSTIDYEEYYSKKVLGSPAYGANYGDYGEKFYSGNTNTGQNPPLGPYSESDQLLANATCDPYSGTSGCLNPDEDYWDFKQLYLISSDGKSKTMFALKDNVLVYLKMNGSDSNEDKLPDTYVCDPSMACADPDAPVLDDFLPVSPPRTKIADLRFYISPLEDPYKAFAEANKSVRIQPHVTMYVKVEPSENTTAGQNKEKLPDVELQATFSSRVYGEVASFAPSV